MKRVYVKEIAKALNEISAIVSGSDIEREVEEKVSKIRAVLLTY